MAVNQASSISIANFGSFFGLDGFVVLVVGLLIFGRKLPEVCRNIGRTMMEIRENRLHAIVVIILAWVVLMLLTLWSRLPR